MAPGQPGRMVPALLELRDWLICCRRAVSSGMPGARFHLFDRMFEY
jgi:hypothetical protein